MLQKCLDHSLSLAAIRIPYKHGRKGSLTGLSFRLLRLRLSHIKLTVSYKGTYRYNKVRTMIIYVYDWLKFCHTEDCNELR